MAVTDYESQAYGVTPFTSGFNALTGLFSGTGMADVLQGLGGIYSLEEAQQRARALGPTVQAQAEQLAQRAGEAAEFQPFTITGTPGGGAATLGPSGIQLTTGAPQQAITEQALTGAQTALQGLLAPRAEREAQLLAELEAARAPIRERERLAEEQRLLAQGRLGTQSMMFGGMTPEEFQRRSLIEEQRARDVLAARTQVGQEQEQAQQLLSGLLGTAYTPQAQALNLLGAAVDPARLAQAGRLSAGEALQAAISPVAQATAKGEDIARQYVAPMVQAYTGLLSPALQTAGTSFQQSGLSQQIGSALESGFESLYDLIF
jgi:hypothetical protein